MRAAIKKGKKESDAAAKVRFQEALSLLPRHRQRTVRRTTEGKTAGWLTYWPDVKYHTDLSHAEFRENLAVRYGYEPPDIQPKCDGCGAQNSLEHALNCTVGGNVIRRHNELLDCLCDMASYAFGESAVKKEVLMGPKKKEKEGVKRDKEEEQGEPEADDEEVLRRIDEQEQKKGVRADMVVRGVWERQKNASFDLCVINADAYYYRKHKLSTTTVLDSHAKMKKTRHLRVCEDRSIHFTPLCVTVDGVWGREAEAFFRRMVEAMHTKAVWRDKSYAQVMGWVRARLSVALARGVSWCVSGGRRHWVVRSAGAADGAGMFIAD